MVLATFYKRIKTKVQKVKTESFTQGHKANERQEPRVQTVLAWTSTVIDLGN